MASFALPIALSPTVRSALFASVEAEHEPAEFAGFEFSHPVVITEVPAAAAEA
jgi:hypothetical protein